MSFRGLSLLAVAAFGASLPACAGITYSCAANVDTTEAGTCAFLNSTVANLYNSTFTNVNATILIQFGITGLGSSTSGFLNDIPYSTYVSDLAANALASGDPIQAAAVAALAAHDSAYASDNVVITSALGSALGIPGGNLVGTTSGASPCHIGDSGCFNGIITVASPAHLSTETGGSQGLYFDQAGGIQPGNDYDFYSIVQHETDEILGTASCIETGGSLTDGCNVLGAGTPSAVDLFRYSAAKTLILDSALSTTPGAFFSYNGGATNGANGAIYNTLANGDDYADYVSNCAFVQDATGCLGKKFNITTDGGAETNILNAVGFDENPVPEPGTFLILAASLAVLFRLRNKAEEPRA